MIPIDLSLRKQKHLQSQKVVSLLNLEGRKRLSKFTLLLNKFREPAGASSYGSHTVY